MFRMNQLYQITKTKKPNFTSQSYSHIRQYSTANKARLPIGYDNFREVIDNKLDFVDKSLFIKEVLNDPVEVAAITRPRLFGRTFNLSMLQYFLAPEINKQNTKGLFDKLKISTDYPEYMRFQGKYPVVFMSFKDEREENYEKACNSLRYLLAKIFREHRYLLESSTLFDEDKKFYLSILEKTTDETALEYSIKNLTKYLYQHHGVRPWLLIDEYDTPLQSAYVNNYYDQMANMMSGLLSRALKSNNCLYRAVMTGFLRLPKADIFSGVNNLVLYSMLDKKYSEYFGFTEEEVTDNLKRANLEDKITEVRKWYNGYQIGNNSLYNPWSIANYIGYEGQLGTYLVDTSENALIKNLLTSCIARIKTDFEKLLQGECIEKFIDDHATLDDLKPRAVDAFWSLLVMSGYLKVKQQTLTDIGLECKLELPNCEVKIICQQIIRQWLAKTYDKNWYYNFIGNLLNNNVKKFKQELTSIMKQPISLHDRQIDPENFYYGLMVGITVSLSNHQDYELKFNPEGDDNRYSYLILSKNANKPDIFIEFKKVYSSEIKDSINVADSLRMRAEESLKQIKHQKYVADAIQRDNTNILKIAIAFCGKEFALQHRDEKMVYKEKMLFK